MLGSLGQVCLAKKLITCYIQLHPARTRLKSTNFKVLRKIPPVIPTHLILAPHSHLMLELKIEWLQKLKHE